VFSTSEPAGTNPEGEVIAAHYGLCLPASLWDTRLLQRISPDSDPLWEGIQACIDKTMGMLVVDDTTLDRPYANNVVMKRRHSLAAA
jgi:hypothetical protein